MIEIPESATVARQAAQALAGHAITDVFNATHPHKFTWWNGDPAAYRNLLIGKKICGAQGHGAFIDLSLEDDTHLAVSDGVNLRCHEAGAPIPEKYQLLLALDDDRFLVCTVAMYGGINVFRGIFENAYWQGALSKPSALEEPFDAAYFGKLVSTSGQNLSVKAFLATEQRIPGLGNGVLQDLLFRARLHPKRKLATLSDADRERLFKEVKNTLREMTAAGGRDTEKDLFGLPGGYRVLLSKNTWKQPCPVCGGCIAKEAYLGGAVYYCPHCQPLK